MEKKQVNVEICAQQMFLHAPTLYYHPLPTIKCDLSLGLEPRTSRLQGGSYNYYTTNHMLCSEGTIKVNSRIIIGHTPSLLF